MSSPNIFAEDWQDCLHAHYLYVLHANDVSNEASLRLVLRQVGFDDATLDSVRDEIQAGVEVAPPDMELEIAEVESVDQTPNAPADVVPADVEMSIADEASAVQDITADLGSGSTDAVVEGASASAAEELPEPPPDDDVKPMQLSLF